MRDRKKLRVVVPLAQYVAEYAAQVYQKKMSQSQLRVDRGVLGHHGDLEYDEGEAGVESQARKPLALWQSGTLQAVLWDWYSLTVEDVPQVGKRRESMLEAAGRL